MIPRTYFKTLLASGSLIAIPLDELRGRLKKHGIKCEEHPDFYCSFLLSGIDGDLTVCLGKRQVCEEFALSECEEFAADCEKFSDPFPHSVVAAIEKEFKVEFVTKDDPRFWSCTNKEELAAKIRKKGQRIDVLESAQKAANENAGSHKKSLSSRVRRTLDIVDDRIDHELDECWEFLFSVPHTAFK